MKMKYRGINTKVNEALSTVLLTLKSTKRKKNWRNHVKERNFKRKQQKTYENMNA